jgi:hypothetical protein
MPGSIIHFIRSYDMRRIALAVVTVIGLSACQQMTTEPAASSNLSIKMVGDNPPPPPIDSGSVGYTGSGTSITFFLRLTYFINKPGTNGWLTLIDGDGNTSDPDARVSVHNGIVSGKGTWYVDLGDGDNLKLDLGTIDGRSSFDRNKGYSLFVRGILHRGEEDLVIDDIHLIPPSPIRNTDGG